MKSPQVIHFHYTMPLRKMSFLDIADHTALVSDQKEHFNKRFEQEIKEQLENLLNMGETLVYFSTSFLENIASYQKSYFNKIQDQVNRGSIHLVGSAAYNSLSFLCHPDLFRNEIALHIESYKKHFGLTSKIFINTAGLFNDQLIDALKGLNFEIVIAPANKWHLTGLNTSDAYCSSGPSPLKIVLSNGEDFDSTHLQLINGYGTGYRDVAFVKSSWSAREKVIVKKKKLEVYAASMPLSSAEWKQSLATYLANPLQKALFSECVRLIDKYAEHLSTEDWKVLMLVCQPELLLELNDPEPEARFDHFVSRMHILAALSLKYKV